MDSRNIRERLERVIRQYGFKLVTQNEDKLSHYYEIRHKGKLQMSVIRISNHCTSPSNWRDRYGSNNPTMRLSNKELRRYRGNYNGLPNKYFKKAFYSLVVYDPKIDGIQQCGNVQEGGILVYQNTYDATQMTNEMLAALENTMQQIAHQDAITENNAKTQYKMKQRIRLTEGDLHRIIRQCVNEARKKFVSAECEPSRRKADLLAKKIQMDSDWNDLKDCYRYGNEEKYDYWDAEDNREYGIPPFSLSDMPKTQGSIDAAWFDHDDIPKRDAEELYYSQKADRGPLHRKGSLNRAFDESSKGHLAESKIRKIVKKVLRENCR
jgi:translation initiation factor IF-1